jgi:hypothetical protein
MKLAALVVVLLAGCATPQQRHQTLKAIAEHGDDAPAAADPEPTPREKREAREAKRPKRMECTPAPYGKLDCRER